MCVECMEIMPDTSKKSYYLRIASYLRPYKARIFGGIFSTIMMGFSDAMLAPLVGWIVDGLSQASASLANSGTVQVVLNGIKLNRFGFDVTIFEPFEIKSVEQAKTVLFGVGAFIVVLVIFKVVFVYAKEYLFASAIQKAVKNIRDQLYSHLLHLKMIFFDRGKTGEIMSRVTNDIQVVENSLMSFVILTHSAVYTVILVTALLVTDWQLSLFALAVVPFAGGVLRFFSNSLRRASRKIMVKLADISAFLQESIAAVKIIKTYNREDHEKKKFADQTYQNYAYSMKAYRLVAFLKPSNEFFTTVGMAVVIIYCGFRIVDQQMNISVFTTFAVLLSMVYKPMKSLGDTVPVIQRAMAAAERIFEVLDQNPEETNEASESLPSPLKGSVEFENVTFSYNGSDTVLKNISLSVQAGEIVALVGPSGVGKSTVLNLLLRFYDCQSGTISIDGKDVATVSRKNIREHMGLVPQETILFSGSVRDNILFGKLDASEQELEDAARIANAHEFVLKLADGYDTEIGERGVQISGGQRQRIAIARAVLKNPPILLLDEATSALDSESENLVQEAMINLMKNRTTFVIAHRLSTVKHADKIVVLGKGTIQQIGTHDTLIGQEGLYKTMYDLQFK